MYNRKPLLSIIGVQAAKVFLDVFHEVVLVFAARFASGVTRERKRRL